MRCECCGERATRQAADGVWLCEDDYQHLLEHWRLEGFMQPAEVAVSRSFQPAGKGA